LIGCAGPPVVVGRKEAVSGAHEGNFRLRVPVQFFQRTGHSTGVDVAGLNGHLLRHDQRVFGIDGGLHALPARLPPSVAGCR
jgi:hypothetical protein